MLIVDDDESLGNILYRILESGGYDVLSASSGPEALAICRRSSSPIDVLSRAYSGQELRAEQDKRKCRFLAKPFRSEELLRKVKQMAMQPVPAWSATPLSL